MKAYTLDEVRRSLARKDETFPPSVSWDRQWRDHLRLVWCGGSGYLNQGDARALALAILELIGEEPPER